MKLSNLILASVFALSFSAFAQGGEQTAPATEGKTVEKTEKAEKTTKDGKKMKMKKSVKKESAPKAE